MSEKVIEKMREKLLPCPFCGGKVQYHPASHRMDNFFNHSTIICPTCDFAMEHVSTMKLIKRWNARKPMERIVKRLENENMTAVDLANLSCSEYQDGVVTGIEKAIEIVKEEGELND